MNQEFDPVIGVLLVVVVAFFVIVFFIGLIMKINDFTNELNYINREIGRTTGEEQRYWKREKRRLWLSLLPFYRR